MRVRRAASGGGGWSPFISVTVALVVLLGWLTWYLLGHRPLSRDGEPSWSPDAVRVTYAAEQNGRRDIFAMNSDGTGVYAVANDGSADEAAPAYSPDGASIAYDADIDGNREIYVVGTNGSNRVRLTNHPARDQAPAWSPDGRKIAFVSDREAPPSFDLYLMNADGTGVERLTSSGNNRAPQFSPDGTRIAFHSNRDVYVLDLATRQLRRLTHEQQTGDGMYPTWSRDSGRIAFMTARSGSMQIFVMNADGSNQKPLVRMPTGNAIEPRWSPKDDRVLFVHVPDEAPPVDGRTSSARAIYVVDVGSEKVTRLSR
jgi:Tol biopolymer transport system component